MQTLLNSTHGLGPRADLSLFSGHDGDLFEVPSYHLEEVGGPAFEIALLIKGYRKP